VINLVETESGFTPEVIKLLAQLAECMIPPGDDLPAASDRRIFADLLNQLALFPDVVTKGVEVFRTEASRMPGGEFSLLDEETQMQIIAATRRGTPMFLQTFEAAVLTAYYRDPRVQKSLGMPGRPPWPGGYKVQTTDWQLLDPVRSRAPFWRPV